MDEDIIYSKEGDAAESEEKITSATFYKLMKNYGFDFDDIDEGTRLPKSLLPVRANKFEAVCKFNHALEMLHRQKLMPILDSVVFLLTDYFDPNELLKFISTNNLNSLQVELKKKYNLNPKEINKIDLFIR